MRARSSYIICGAQCKMKCKTPCSNSRGGKVFSFFLWPSSQSVFVFLFATQCCVPLDEWVLTERVLSLTGTVDSMLDSTCGHKNPANPSPFLHQSGRGGGEWERQAAVVTGWSRGASQRDGTRVPSPWYMFHWSSLTKQIQRQMIKSSRGTWLI